MKTCIICLHDAQHECGIEVCPNRSEHKHIGVDIGSRDATVVATISPTGELEGLVTSEREVIITVPSLMGWERLMHNSSPWTSLNECSHTENPERKCDCFGGFCAAGDPCPMENKG